MTDTQEIAKKRFDWRAAIDKRADTFAASLPDDISVEAFLAVCK